MTDSSSASTPYRALFESTIHHFPRCPSSGTSTRKTLLP
jgi:hypothetical protein